MFYDRFLELCEMEGVTPANVADSVGLNKSTMYMWKKQGTTPKYDTIRKLADYFDVTTDYMLGKKGAAMRYSFQPFPTTGERYTTGSVVSEDTFKKIVSDTKLPPEVLWRDENGVLHIEFSTDEIDDRNACNLLRLVFKSLNTDGRKKVAEYAEDILPRYRREEPPESAPPASDGTPDGSEEPQEGGDGAK